jgi:membrane-associated phospholipid phosphatase
VEVVIVIVLFIISLIAFITISRYIFVIKEDRFDYQVFDYLKHHVSARNSSVMLFFTFLGTHLFLIPANLILIGFFLFIKKHKWYTIKIPVIAISSVALMFLLKTIFNRQRPDLPLLREAKGLSFPSGHAFMSVTFYGLLIYIVWQTVKNKWVKWILIIVLILLIHLIGFSRIYLRVHYPSDVLAGFATGFLWLVISIWIMGRIEKYSRRKLIQVIKSESKPAV